MWPYVTEIIKLKYDLFEHKISRLKPWINIPRNHLYPIFKEYNGCIMNLAVSWFPYITVENCKIYVERSTHSLAIT